MRVSQVLKRGIAAELVDMPVGVQVGVLQRVFGLGVVAKMARATRNSFAL